jgi:hypothetical protein
METTGVAVTASALKQLHELNSDTVYPESAPERVGGPDKSFTLRIY